jgi:hypothetical protein
MTLSKQTIDTYTLRTGKTIIAVLILASLAKGAFAWGDWRADGFSIHLQSPIQNFLKIEYNPDQPVSHRVVKEVEAKPVDPATLSTEDYICYVFGPDCKMALAVSQAENGTRQCDRFGVNTDKSIDVGVFQINSIHLKKGYTLADLLNCHKNVDIAYDIFKAQNWSPWVAYLNQSYKRFLNQ